MTEVFDQVCPIYMSYGMTYEQFWYGDPYMTVTFRDAYILNRRIRNEELWIQGLYNVNAFRAVIASALGGRNEKYTEKPFDIFPKTETERKQEKVEAKNKLIKFLSAWMNTNKDKVSKGDDKNGEP